MVYQLSLYHLDFQFLDNLDKILLGLRGCDLLDPDLDRFDLGFVLDLDPDHDQFSFIITAFIFVISAVIFSAHTYQAANLYLYIH